MCYSESSKHFIQGSAKNVEEAESFYRQSLANVKIQKIDTASNSILQFNAVKLGNNSLVCSTFSGQCEIQGELNEDDIRIVIGNNIPSHFYSPNNLLTTSPNRAVIIQNSEKLKVTRESESQTLVICSSTKDLNDNYERFFNNEAKFPIELKQEIPINNGIGLIFKRIITSLYYDLSTNYLILDQDSLIKGYDELILGSILSLHKNNTEIHSFSTTQYHSNTIVNRSEEYMSSNFTGQVSIGDLLDECGCTREALFSSFQHSRNYTPMAFLQEQRLQAARDKLSDADTHEDSVSTIALSCGFTHLGRFSQSYKKRFGELPSATFRNRPKKIR